MIINCLRNITRLAPFSHILNIAINLYRLYFVYKDIIYRESSPNSFHSCCYLRYPIIYKFRSELHNFCKFKKTPYISQINILLGSSCTFHSHALREKQAPTALPYSCDVNSEPCSSCPSKTA